MPGKMMRKMKKILRNIAVLCLLAFGACMILGGCRKSSEIKTLRVAIPYSNYVQDPETNYYIGWLEKKTGLKLEIITIYSNRTAEYLDTLFSEESDVDVIMFGDRFKVTEEELNPYVQEGEVLKLENGEFYYPNYGSAAGNEAGQILYINYEWLLKLNLSVPQTIDELYDVLKAFKERDPNGNGVKDEMPMIGSSEGYAYLPTELLLNSYVYNDPYNNRFEYTPEGDRAAYETDEFREGLAFVRKLYEESLLDNGLYSGRIERMSELVNNSADIVGAFTTDSISDVIYPGNPEIMAKFIHVAPLIGPNGVCHALWKEKQKEVGAVICGKSSRKEEAKLLLDTMMTEEASLIARFGEQGVDWDFSQGLDISIYGSASTITTKNYLWNMPQNKHLKGIGPMDVPEKYLKGVTWNGVNSDTEYIDARARKSYQEFLPASISRQKKNAALDAYIDESIRKFTDGTENINDDEAWQKYLDGLKGF